MRKLKLTVLLMLCIFITPLPVVAGDFDGSQPLLCAFIDIIECGADDACNEVTAESINAPQFLKIDFKRKKISATHESGDKRTTEIMHMGLIDGKLILQGMEDGQEGVRDGLGWSMAIAQETGKMVLTGSGDQVGFVVFGACMPQ